MSALQIGNVPMKNDARKSVQRGDDSNGKESIEPLLNRIETAPRDGTTFLALDRLGHPHIVWGDKRGFFDERDGDKCAELEWWAPIPRPPTK